MNLYPERHGYRFFKSATSSADVVPGLVLSQNDDEPMTVQITDGISAQDMSGFAMSLIVVDAPNATVPPTQLALTVLTVSGTSAVGLLQLDTPEMAEFLGDETTKKCTLSIFAQKTDLTEQFERTIPLLVRARSYNTGSIAPITPTGTMYFFNQSTGRFEFYISGVLVGTIP